MRTVAVAALTIALLPAAAYSQEQQGPPTRRTGEQKKQDAEIEKAYQEVQKGIKAQTPSTNYDPWGTIRQAAPSDKPKR